MTTTQQRPAAAPLTDHPKWFEGNFGVFDCETTGIDPLTARMVSYASLYVSPRDEVLPQSKWGLVDPGIPIPAEATAIHGITDERAKTGISHDSAVRTMVGELSYLRAAKEPLVIFNAPYDLTILFVQARALGVALPEVLVLDPLIIDKSLNQYRPGSRKLDALCRIYDVTLTDAHDARGDALATAQLILKMSQKHSQLAWRLDLIHKAQVKRQEEWAKSYERYLRKSDPAAVVDRGWPIKDEALGIERTEQDAMFDVPEKPKREHKRYDIPEGAPTFKCREESCDATVRLVPTGNGDGKVVVDPSGYSHFLTCKNPNRFSRGVKA